MNDEHTHTRLFNLADPLPCHRSTMQIGHSDFEYYWAIVNSRSFHWKPPGSKPGYMVLCPFIDYLNHGPSGTGVNVNQTSRGYEAWTDRNYQPGEELLLTYGAHSNDKLLVSNLPGVLSFRR